MCLIRQIFGKMAEYSAFYRILGIRPNVPIRQNIRTFFGSECSYSAESENPVSFEHCVTLQKSARDFSAYACWGNISALLSAVAVTGVYSADITRGGP